MLGDAKRYIAFSIVKAGDQAFGDKRAYLFGGKIHHGNNQFSYQILR